MDSPSSPPSAAALAREADAAEAAAAEDGATTRSPFKRLASRTLSDRWMQELQASPDDLARAPRVAVTSSDAQNATHADASPPCRAAVAACAAQSAREAKSIHFDAPGAAGGEDGAQAGGDGDPMCDEAPTLRGLRPSDAAPASPAHAERSGAFPTPWRAHAARDSLSLRFASRSGGSDAPFMPFCTPAPAVSQTRCRC